MSTRTEKNQDISKQIFSVIERNLDMNSKKTFRIPFNQLGVPADEVFPASRRNDWNEFCERKHINVRVSRTKGFLRIKRVSESQQDVQAHKQPVATFNVDKNFYYVPEESDVLQKGIIAGLNILVYGPAGTGKSTLLRKILEKNVGAWEFMNLNGETSVDDFVGVYELVGGETILRKGILPQCMESGTPLIIDELDAASPEVLFILQGVLEGNPLRLKNGEQVHPASGFAIYATANTIGRGDDTTLYQGTNVLNEAFMDRFGMVLDLWYMPKPHEIEVVCRKTGMHKAISEKIVTVASLARDAMKSGKLYSTFSTRKCLSWASLMMQNVGFEDAFKLTCTNKVAPADRVTLAELYQRATGKTIRVD